MLPQTGPLPPVRKVWTPGGELAMNKRAIHDAFRACGVLPERRALLMAMAFLETEHLTARERDRSKDGTPSENVSLWNLSADLVRFVGIKGDIRMLNHSLQRAVCLLDKALTQLGVVKTLHFVCGGRAAYEDSRSHGAQEYVRAIAAILSAIDKDPALLTDGRRADLAFSIPSA